MKISKPFAITYLADWLILIFATPKPIFYSGEGTLRWIVFGVLFFLLPYLLYQCIADTALSAKLKIGIPIA